MKWVYLELHGVHGDGVGQTGGAPADSLTSSRSSLPSNRYTGYLEFRAQDPDPGFF